MAANVPIFNQLSIKSLVVQIIIIGLLFYLYYYFNLSMPFVWAALSYSLLALILRKSIAKNHREGIKLVLQKKYAEAIPYFEKSVAYFTKKNWVDKFRFLTLLSATYIPYKQMGLCNIAFCYSQIGKGQKAKEYYQQSLNEFPDNGIAITALNMLNSVDTKVTIEEK